MRALIRIWKPAELLLLTGLIVSCSGGDTITVPPPEQKFTISGKVYSRQTNAPLSSAQVALGFSTTTTGADGSYSFTGVSQGTHRLVVNATGFDQWTEDIVVETSNVTRDVRLGPAEHFTVNANFSMYVPASVSKVSAVFIALGGPDTRGFVSGSFNITGAPDNVTVNSQLNSLALSIQNLAVTRQLAILGASIGGGDDALISALNDAARVTGHPEIASAPVILLSISGGGPGAASFAIHYPQRIVGLYMRVPDPAEALANIPGSPFPTYIVMADNDDLVNNKRTSELYQGLRNAGWPAAIAVEHGVVHYGFSFAQQSLAVAWINTILTARLDKNGSNNLNPVDLTTGWLGNPATGEIAPWAAYSGDLSAASWFPNSELATQWQAFIR